MPFGTIPVLEVDGKQFSGSNNILRYLGKLTGFYPTDPVDQGRVDEVLEGVEETLQRSYLYSNETDPVKKEDHKKLLIETTYPKWIGRFEKIHERNGNPVGSFIVGDKMTVADIKLAFLIRNLRSKSLPGLDPSFTEAFPRVMGVVKRVFLDERISAYCAKNAVNSNL